MNENPINPPTQSEGPAVNAGSSDPLDLIQKANFAADRLEAANKELAKLLSAQQKLHVEKTLSGVASSNVKTETAEEKAIQNAKAFLAGSGLEDYANLDGK